MFRTLLRVAMAAGCGAVLGMAAVTGWHATSPDVVIGTVHDLPDFVSGAYAAERDGERTFVWTSSRVVIRLDGIDRRTDWTCTIRLRGARDASHPMPTLEWSFDGMGSVATELSNEFEDVALDVPARPDRAGLTLVADVGPTFRPGGADPRELGAQVEGVRCAASGWVWPPTAALSAAAILGGALPAALALVGSPALLIAAIAVLVSAGFAVLLTSGAAAFGSYPSQVTAFGLWAAAIVAVAAVSPIVVGRRRLSGAALVAVALSVTFAFLKLAAVEHPIKGLVDALFQAHRLEWVMAGRYFFTQPMPSGVQFPYAIGLYVTAAPLASWISDHVLLLRLVVLAVEAAGGLLLFAVINRAFQDRGAGVLAVILFHLVPGSHLVVGNGNLTNAFAQAVGLAALCVLALMPTPSRHPRAMLWAVAGTGVIALSFLSHVGTIVVLAAILGSVVVVWLLGRRQELTRMAVATIVMTTLAGALAVGLYYRHFVNVYRDAFARVQAPAAAAPAPADPRPNAPAILVRPLTWSERVGVSGTQTVADLGWPLITLGVVGLVTRVAFRRERAALLLLGWSLAWVLLLVTSTLTRVEVQFQRYAVEFVSRINLAAYPMLVAAGALATTWLWQRRTVGRLVAGAALVAAVLTGLASLGRWLG